MTIIIVPGSVPARTGERQKWDLGHIHPPASPLWIKRGHKATSLLFSYSDGLPSQTKLFQVTVSGLQCMSWSNGTRNDKTD